MLAERVVGGACRVGLGTRPAAGRSASVLARTHLVTRSALASRASRQALSTSTAAALAAIAAASASPPPSRQPTAHARSTSTTAAPVSWTMRETKVTPMWSTSAFATSAAMISRRRRCARTAAG